MRQHRLLVRAQRRDDDRRVLPLINVVFLLLIFFMLAGRLAAGDAFPVEPPHAERAAAGEGDEPVVLVGHDGRLGYRGEIVTLPALVARLQQRGVDRVRLKGDARAEAVQVVEVLQTLNDAGIGRVRLLTTLRQR